MRSCSYLVFIKSRLFKNKNFHLVLCYGKIVNPHLMNTGNGGSSCKHIFRGFGVDSLDSPHHSRLLPGRLLIFPQAPSLYAEQEHHLGVVLWPTWDLWERHSCYMFANAAECFLDEVDQVLSVCTDFLPVLPACASGAHSGAVGHWWLSCVEVGWGEWPQASCLFS